MMLDFLALSGGPEDDVFVLVVVEEKNDEKPLLRIMTSFLYSLTMHLASSFNQHRRNLSEAFRVAGAMRVPMVR